MFHISAFVQTLPAQEMIYVIDPDRELDEMQGHASASYLGARQEFDHHQRDVVRHAAHRRRRIRRKPSTVRLQISAAGKCAVARIRSMKASLPNS